jgi:hypothetical protein
MSIAESFFRKEDKINLDILGRDSHLIDQLIIDFLPYGRESIIQQIINQAATLLNFEPCRMAIKALSAALGEGYEFKMKSLKQSGFHL